MIKVKITNGSILPCLLLLAMSIILASCKRNEKDLEISLINAGKNRTELEKVLKHYKKNVADSLKYKAACFLIMNMDERGYYSNGRSIELLNLIDSLSTLDLTPEAFSNSVKDFYSEPSSLQIGELKVLDISSISSKYLINNIDRAFYTYANSSWGKQIDFNTFCDYVLPYRIGTEMLEDFREPMYNKYKFIFDTDSMSMEDAANAILNNNPTGDIEDLISFSDRIPNLPLSYLLKLKSGSCLEISSLCLFTMRSIGLPVAQDFAPIWANRGIGHLWNSLLLSADSCLPFFAAEGAKVGEHHIGRSNETLVSKVYRNTFSKQLNNLCFLNEDEPIPKFFENPYIKDVTHMYTDAINICVNIPDGQKNSNKFAYLCTFNNRKWIPIHWGRIKGSTVEFTRMGKNVVYLPAKYLEGGIHPIGYPFLVDSIGSIVPLVPNWQNTQSIALKRKYPLFGWWKLVPLSLIGGRIQAGNNENFTDAITVYQIEAYPEMYYHTELIDEKRKYKYWRYLAPDLSKGHLSELEFYDDKNNKIMGKIIGTKVVKKSTAIENAFDGDPLTSFIGDSSVNNWVGLSFDSPKRVAKVRYLGRNDDNFVKRNELYELFYWRSEGWISLGQRIGTDSQNLTFSDVPTNALFLLRNLTKGKEERIFTYNDNKQFWW